MSSGFLPGAARIFVNIASYADPECAATVRDLFEKAAHPERVFVGICWQGEGSLRKLPRSRQVRLVRFSCQESQGMNWARRQAQSLREGEAYTLMIDSHMRFNSGWDEALLTQLLAYPPGKAVISGVLPCYRLPEKLEKAPPPKEDAPQAFIVTSNLFAESELLERIAPDPHVFFHGTAVSYSARLWTHGVDVHAPQAPVLYHYHPAKKARQEKPYQSLTSPENLKSVERMLHVLGTKISGDKKALREIARYGLGKERPLAEFWTFSGYHPGKSAGEVAEENVPKDLPRIFVRIASYRDPECQWTVKDLFEKAAHPERIFVGICWQFDPYRDKECFEIPPPRPEQVHTIKVHWENTLGVCWARAQTETLWRGEEYTLQIDSHMRFAPGWDEKMIAELAECPSPKPLISCNPAHYTPPDHLQKDPLPSIRRVMPFTPQGDVRGTGEVLNRPPPHPLNGAFVAGGYVFSRSEVLKEVPYDPYLYYNQEEINYAARLYTHGWDIFSSRQVLLYHYYTLEVATRPLHWDDAAAQTITLQRQGLARNLYLLAGQACNDPDALREIESYGLGKERTLAQYEEYSGVYFARRQATERALRCWFVKDLEKYRDRPIFIPELDSARHEEKKKSAAKLTGHLPLETPDRKLTPQILQPGDFIPFFELLTAEYAKFEMHNFGGKKTLLIFAQDDEAALSRLFAAFTAHKEQWRELEVIPIMILPVAPGRLRYIQRQFRTGGYVFCSDYRFALSHAFGFYQKDRLMPHAVLVNPNLQVAALYADPEPEKLFGQVKADVKRFFPARKPKLLKPHAPVLMVPNVLSAELCREMIEYFHSHQRIDGLVGAGKKAAYRPKTKIRTDCFVSGMPMAKLDEAFSRSLFPEIRKVYNLDITQREPYKIGCYESERGGFFGAHRDSTDLAVSYRRYALSLNLNDDFEGGEVSFPEYGEDYYKPPAGGAMIFPCSLMHRAAKVAAGRRFMVVGFFHGAEQEALRHALSQADGQRDGRRHYILHSARRYTGVVENRLHIGEMGNNPAIHSGALFSPSLLSADAAGYIPGGRKRPWLDAPHQVLLLPDFLPREVCAAMVEYASGQPAAKAPAESRGGHAAVPGDAQSQLPVPKSVALGRITPEVLTVMIDAYGRRLAPYYGVEFEWFERPRLMRYDQGAQEDKHTDAEIWSDKEKGWLRAHDRDYSVILCLNDEFEGGQLCFTHFNHKIQPKAGMLIAFPSDHRYEYTVTPVTSGTRYALLSWGAALGTERAGGAMPEGSIPLMR